MLEPGVAGVHGGDCQEAELGLMTVVSSTVCRLCMVQWKEEEASSEKVFPLHLILELFSAFPSSGGT